MKLKTRHRLVQLLVGAVILACFVYLNYSSNAVNKIIHRLDQIVYDVRLKWTLKPLEKTQIVIVDIDNESLKKEGRWPWPRERMGELMQKISNAGAAVIALDIVSSEKETNIARQLSEKLKDPKDLALKKTLLDLLPQVDGDILYSQQLKKLQPTDMVLGYLFVEPEASGPHHEGALPKGLSFSDLGAPPDLMMTNFQDYIANVELLQNAVTSAGFLTTLRDSDGVVRQIPLLIKHGGEIYPSLALEAVRTKLLLTKPKDLTIQFSKIGDHAVIDSITVGKRFIHTDQLGNIIIPYRGGAKTFPYFSAADVLSGKLSPNDLKKFEDAIVFVGATASALGDMQATPVSAVFPGVEIHATVADALLKTKDLTALKAGKEAFNEFHYRPNWAQGAELLFTVFLGIILVCVMPFLNIYWLVGVALFSFTGTLSGNFLLWDRAGLVFSAVIPLLMILSLFIFHVAYGFFFEHRAEKRIKRMFGEYVPPEYVSLMSENPEAYGLEGESRVMSVLFSDIRNFTTLSEHLNAGQVKKMLNDYLTPITKVIFDHEGTVDKYVGDMIVAFWGAPVSQEDHAYNAVRAGLAMLDELEKLKVVFKNQGLPVFDIGIGVNTGLMNVGDMGSHYRKAYTVLGDAVNLGSRLESLTKTYGVKMIVSEFTMAEITKRHSDLVFRALDTVKVKGKDVAVKIYEVSHIGS